MNVAHWVVRTLKESGVAYVFTLCGNGLNPFYDACLDLGMKLIDVRNEQAASYMADAWGRMTGQLGVVAVSSGPGHTNALTGLANAFWDGGPMLLISGCSAAATLGMDHFQELDQVGMAAPICKYASTVRDVRTLQQEVNNALLAAVTGRPGPVHLTIPVDVFQSEVDEGLLVPDEVPPTRITYRAPGDPALVQEAVELLASAQRPFMIVGSGAFYAQAWGPLAQFARLTDIPIVSHIWDRGVIEEAIPQYVGVTNADLNRAMALMAQADVIATIGARIDYRVGHGRPPALGEDVRLIRVDAEPSEIDRTRIADVGIVGDARSVVQQMVQEARSGGSWSHTGWLKSVRARRDRFLESWVGVGQGDIWPVPAIRICREIKPFLTQDITFLIDGGNIGRWAHMSLFDRHPSHWFTCGVSGVVGWGLPGAVALKLARPTKPLLLLSGDGAAGFTVSEIETAMRFGTPYVAVIAHDSAWGIVADGQPEGRRVACELGEIRFDRVAEALGARGVYIEHPDQIGPAIDEGLQADTVTMIHVPTQLAGIAQCEERLGRSGMAGR